jgi:hypothetical protein
LVYCHEHAPCGFGNRVVALRWTLSGVPLPVRVSLARACCAPCPFSCRRIAQPPCACPVLCGRGECRHRAHVAMLIVCERSPSSGAPNEAAFCANDHCALVAGTSTGSPEVSKHFGGAACPRYLPFGVNFIVKRSARRLCTAGGKTVDFFFVSGAMATGFPAPCNLATIADHRMAKLHWCIGDGRQVCSWPHVLW